MRVSELSAMDVGPFSEVSLTFPEGKRQDRADVIYLVGPNGAGKSTLLYAIAEGLSQYGSSRLLRSAESMVRVGASHGDRTWKVELRQPTRKSAWVAGQPLDPAETRPLVYAYSGVRSWDPVRSKRSSSSRAVSFDHGEGVEAFTQWIDRLLATRDRAAAVGAQTELLRFNTGLDIAERILCDFTGREFSFDRDLQTGELLLRSNGEGVPLRQLPEGLKSVLSWLGDLLKRLFEEFKSDASTDIASSQVIGVPFVLLLDEIEVHLHPSWQRSIIPTIERVFPNAQIFVSTHSPFVLGSATDAQIVWLDEKGEVRADLQSDSLRGVSYTGILELMGIKEALDVETQAKLRELHEIVRKSYESTSPVESNRDMEREFDRLVQELPVTEDVTLVVDVQRAQLAVAFRRREDGSGTVRSG